MLRRVPGAGFRHLEMPGYEGTYFDAGSSAVSMSVDKIRQIVMDQAHEPQAVKRDSKTARVWWLYQDEVYWEDDDLSAQEVQALVEERQQRARRRIDNAVQRMERDRAGGRNSSGNTPADILGSIDGMSGPEFEDLAEALFKAMGYHVRRTQASYDGGYDLDLDNNDRRILVECKRHSKPIGVSVVRQLAGVVNKEGADKGIVCTNQIFTTEAEAFASESRIELMDGIALSRLHHRYMNPKKPPTAKPAPWKSGDLLSPTPKGRAGWDSVIETFLGHPSKATRFRIHGVPPQKVLSRLDAAVQRKGRGEVKVEHVSADEFRLTYTQASSTEEPKPTRSADAMERSLEPRRSSTQEGALSSLYGIASTKNRSKRRTMARNLAGRKPDLKALRRQMHDEPPPKGFEKVSQSDLANALRLVSFTMR